MLKLKLKLKLIIMDDLKGCLAEPVILLGEAAELTITPVDHDREPFAVLQKERVMDRVSDRKNRAPSDCIEEGL